MCCWCQIINAVLASLLIRTLFRIRTEGSKIDERSLDDVIFLSTGEL